MPETTPNAEPEARTGPLGWIDARTGLLTAWDQMMTASSPRREGFRYALRTALAGAFGVEVVTGLLLMLGYAPSAESAWGSTYGIDQILTGGWFLRGLHNFAAHGMIVIAAIYLASMVLSRALFAPKEVLWLLGLAWLGILIGFTLTGNALPWDQDGYWAWNVETGIAGGAPVLGPYLQRLIVGGTALGNATLGRLYALHVGVLPILALVILRAQVVLARRAEAKTQDPVEPLWPNQAIRNVIAFAAFFLLICGLVALNKGVSLEAPADPSSDYPARPAWFFLWLFELRKSFPGPQEFIATMVVPGALTTVLIALPFLDRLLPRKAAHFLACALLFVVAGGAGFLTFQAVRADMADAHFTEGLEAAEFARERAFALALEGVPPEGGAAMMARDPLTRGKAVFDAKCLGCHAFDGHRAEGGMAAPDLKGFGTRAWVRALLEDPDTDAFFLGIKKCDPKLSGMAQWRKGKGKSLTAEELDQLAEFVAGFADIPPDEPQAIWENSEAVQEHPGYALYADQCAGCHLFGEADEGNFGPSLLRWGSFQWFRRIVRQPDAPDLYGMVEPSCQMPSYASQLTETDIDVLYRYLRGTN